MRDRLRGIDLTARGVEFDGAVSEQRWGVVTTITLPGGGRLGLYQPRHASPLPETS